MKEILLADDVEMVEEFTDYLRNNYKEEKDFVVWIAYGDDYANAIDVSEELLNDSKVVEYIEHLEVEENEYS